LRTSILLALLCTAVFACAQDSTLKWYKGNTHTHSYWSDGDDFPEMIMEWYKSRNYDFIALSDHNILANVEKWKEISANPFRQRRFQEYLKKYGEKWVQYKTDSSGKINVKLKMLDEYRPLFEEPGKFLIIQAEELSDGYKGKPIHINVVNVKELVQPQGGNSVAEVIQNNLNEIYAQRKKTGQPMFPHINHPNFQWAIKIEDMMELKGERFFEVFNGHPHVHNYGDSTTMGMEELWDKLLIHYIGQGKELLYGLATDDTHNYLEYKVGLANPGRGWIMVRAASLNAAAIIDAMEKGNFYATTGVELKEIRYQKNNLEVIVNEQPGVNYTIEFWGATGSGKNKKRALLKTVHSSTASYKVKHRDLYVRAKIISSRPKENPFQTGDMETAWTQPVRP
jgi:hypothetical protein